MDNLRNSIKLYFSELDPDKVLSKNTGGFQKIKKETFIHSSFSLSAFDNRTHDELDNLYQKVTEDWMYAPGQQHAERGCSSPFYLLTHFNEQLLKEIEIEPFVRFHHLLKWRDLTFHLGEDTFTTSFLAYRDTVANKSRRYFSWRPVLFSDNRRLHELLQKGVAENHSHLWASSLTFDLSWIALVNHFPSLREKLKDFQKKYRLNGKTSHQFNTETVEFETLVKKAIALRLVLWKSVDFFEKRLDVDGYTHRPTDYMGKNQSKPVVIKNLRAYLLCNEILGFDIEDLFHPSNNIDSHALKMNFDSILSNISILAQESGLKLPHKGKKKVVDYALTDDIHPQNFNGCYFVSGERRLLYRAFSAIYTSLGSKREVETLEKLLQGYLLIKNIFRKEIIQLNERYGFSNFKEFQDRKLLFLSSNSLYTTIFLDITLNYNRQLMKITSNEMRISTEANAYTLKETIRNILRIREYHESEYDWEKQLLGVNNPLKIITEESIRLKENKPNELYFVIHFFKRIDELFYSNSTKNQRHKREIEIKQAVTSRDAILRKIVRQHANALRELREKHPDFAQWIRGIDAASIEIAARPEVFAQAFRMLKYHQLRHNYADVKGKLINNQLNITFHAGEDFFDIVDGMRYMDECIRFLGMERGDRFGHGVAIGIDVSKYYELKKQKILLSKQMLLDNIAWLLSKVRKFGLAHHMNEVYRLENIYKSLFSEIFINSSTGESYHQINYSQYYDAWKLRGDDPAIYYDYFGYRHVSEHRSIHDYFERMTAISYWDRCGLNQTNSKLDSIRKRKEISRIYFEYHYNPDVQNKGAEIKQFEITPEYRKLVEDVQFKMAEHIGYLNIAIETNPTSNYLIGPIHRYVEHPITRWYNLGLETDHEKIQKSPQLSVSINTDDAGIFATSLENEYALLAIALEKEKDESGKPKYKPAMIYDWLDRIREMGLQQSFLGSQNKKSNN